MELLLLPTLSAFAKTHKYLVEAGTYGQNCPGFTFGAPSLFGNNFSLMAFQIATFAWCVKCKHAVLLTQPLPESDAVAYGGVVPLSKQ